MLVCPDFFANKWNKHAPVRVLFLFLFINTHVPPVYEPKCAFFFFFFFFFFFLSFQRGLIPPNQRKMKHTNVHMVAI